MPAGSVLVARIRERGVEVYLLSDLLAETFGASDGARQRLIELVASEYTVGWSLVDEVRNLLDPGIDDLRCICQVRPPPAA